MIGLFLFLSVPIGHLMEIESNILTKEPTIGELEPLEKLNLTGLTILPEDERLTDISLIADQQELYFKENNKYLHVPEFACLVGRCRVDEYKTPAGDRGYITIFMKTENQIDEISIISSGKEIMTAEWQEVTIDENKNEKI